MKQKTLLFLIMVLCVFMFFSEEVIPQKKIIKKLPDLKVKFTAPRTITAGTDIGSKIKLKVWNQGNAPAAGTDTARNNGYMVDLVLSTDTRMPAGMATYSPNFHEDVLLKGGRISNTKTLRPRQARTYPVGAGIPADAPKGKCYLCAKVDSNNKIRESNERNNVFCQLVYIKGKGGGGKDNCKIRYPFPRIKFDHRDTQGRVYIPVINWKSYSNAMFRKAPDLPPCGKNTNSARTWVDIYDGKTNKRIYGFCAFDSKDDLKKIWFMSKARSGRVYIIMKDRACKRKYRSNTISWPR